MRPATNQEADAASLKLNVVAAKVRAFDYMKHLLSLSPAQLKHTGHKTIEDAIMFSLKFGIGEIKAMNDAFIKKYPD